MRPNVLVIVTDDQRWGTLAVMPNTQQRFLREGRTFPRAFVTTPLCCPSRASVFSGRYAHNHRVKNNRTPAQLEQDTTVQRYLRTVGYTTAMAGIYLNSWPLANDPPHFDAWAIMTGKLYRNPYFNINGEVGKQRGYTTNLLANQALDLLSSFEDDDSQPWFLYVATPAPHPPAHPARKYVNAAVPSRVLTPSLFEEDRSDKPPWIRRQRASLFGSGAVRARQLRTLMSVDDLVGRLFDELDALDERRDTIAFFISDNGFLWGEHGVVGKRRPYPESVRIPLAVTWPGHIAGGSTDQRLAANIDLAPTILSAARVAPAQPMDGRSLLDRWVRRRVFTEYWGSARPGRVPSWDAIQTPKVHYIQYYDDDRSEIIFREYYRLVNDPWELHNLLGDRTVSNDPETRSLERLIRRYSRCSDSSCP